MSAIGIVAALAVVWRTSRASVPATAHTQLETVAAPEVAAVQPDSSPAPATAPAPAASVARPRAARSVSKKPTQTTVATNATSPRDVVLPLPAADTARAAASETVKGTATASVGQPHLTADAVHQTPVTITGCLETTVDEERFRLTDTDGADAPKARSWRSGFLKKRPTPVELVDLPNRSMLRKYVGYRVVATGLFTNRQLRVRSLQPAGASCN